MENGKRYKSIEIVEMKGNIYDEKHTLTKTRGNNKHKGKYVHVNGKQYK